jgi:hypothetical protein
MSGHVRVAVSLLCTPDAGISGQHWLVWVLIVDVDCLHHCFAPESL